MSLKSKIQTDRIFGKPLVVVLNVITRFMGFLLRIDHSFSNNPKRIVVCKFMGMGSIIQATPLLQTLRKNFPQSFITFVSTESNRAVLSLFPFINEIICVNDKNIFNLIRSTWNLLFRLWNRKADIYIDLETYSYYSTIIATLSVARNRLGFYRKKSNVRTGLFTHTVYFDNKAPIPKVYLQMAQVAGCKTIYEELFSLRPEDYKRKNIIKKISEKFPVPTDKKIIVINPNASDIRIERRWDAENFVHLIENILDHYQNTSVFLIGNKAEKDYVSGIFNKISASYQNRITDTSGQLNLSELIVLIDSSDIFITNDTGPMHIAFSLKKSTIALFGPCSPQQYGIAESAICLYKNLHCSPCVHEFDEPPCKGNNECMKLINVNEVMEVLQGNTSLT